MSLRLCGARFNFLVAVCVGGPLPSLLGVQWPLAGVRQAGVASSGMCGGLLGLDRRLVSLALVLWCALVRRVVFVPFFTVLRRACLCCVVVRPALLCRAAPCRAVVCCAVPRRAASCCGVLCLGVPCRGALHGHALRCGVPCCLVLCRGGCVGWGRWWLDSPVTWCGTRVEVLWLAGGWGVRLAVGLLAGSVLRGSGCAPRAGGSGGCSRACPPWGLVLWSRVLWGPLPLALGAAAVSFSSSGACVVALAVAGAVA